ncbi:MAG: SDR family oxidoreductase [Rhodothermales bacterium]|nr:SDR family oxidoreductase [Rhodothermales bacterium]
MDSDHIVVTGASQGIGRTVALEFARRLRGCTITLMARTAEKLKDTAEMCEAEGADTRVVACDLTKDEAVDAATKQILEDAPPVTCLANIAGMYQPGDLADTTTADVIFQFDVNVLTGFRMTKRLLPGMIERGRGHIFFTGSVASTKGYPGGFSYCIAKHGVLGLARGIREDTKGTGVAVTCVMPGATWSPSWEGSGVDPERMMPAEDIAAMIVQTYQLSPRAVVEEILLRPQKGDV